MINRLWKLLALGASLLTAASLAQAMGLSFQAAGTGTVSAHVKIEAAESPSVVIRHVVQQLLAKLEAEGELKHDAERLHALVNEIVDPHFDIEGMSRIVLGKHRRRASPDVFQRFVEEFRGLLIRTYATSLLEYEKQEIHFFPEEHRPDGQRAFVQLEIRRSGAPAIPVGFRLHHKRGKWMVYDVQIEGISLVANYRTQFSSAIRKDGLETLISQLANRNQSTKVVLK